MKKFLLPILFLLLAAGLAGWIWLRRFERGQLYRPVAELAATPAQFSLRYQDVQFNAADGTPLAGWWIPANSPRGTVVFCHGNAVNVGAVAVLAPEFFRRGFNLLLWDYRGYGASAGRPSENGIYADARAAFDAAQAMSDKLPILVYGHSLGAAVAVQLAQDRPVAGLIVDGGFLSTADLARRFYPHLPFDRLLSQAYDSGPKVAALAGPAQAVRPQSDRPDGALPERPPAPWRGREPQDFRLARRRPQRPFLVRPRRARQRPARSVPCAVQALAAGSARPPFVLRARRPGQSPPLTPPPVVRPILRTGRWEFPTAIFRR
jgi:pimeloyl-ACP methyl ester carboxylesterase